jgi:hypothetical protein
MTQRQRKRRFLWCIQSLCARPGATPSTCSGSCKAGLRALTNEITFELC